MLCLKHYDRLSDEADDATCYMCELAEAEDELTTSKERIQQLYASHDRKDAKITDLRIKLENRAHEMDRLRAKLAAAEAASGAYLTFMLTELDWKWFRAETFGDTASEQNAKKLRDWLAENGDPGPAFLERITAAEEDKERLDWAEMNVVKFLDAIFEWDEGGTRDTRTVRAAIDDAAGEE